jgi:hypothetical protein
MAYSDPTVSSGNLKGWVQYRKLLKNENIEHFSGPENLNLIQPS